MITLRLSGIPGVEAMLRPYTPAELPKRMQGVTKAGATVFKAPLKAEARPLSKRLARSVSVRTAKRNRPATIVTFRPKVAFFRAWIIDGTKDHGPKRAKALVFRGKDGDLVVAHRVRGVPPNPIVARVEARFEGRAYQAMSEALDKEGA